MAESIQRPGSGRTAWSRFALCLLAGLASASARPAAHDIPASVTAQVFVRAEGQTLRLLMRVPLVSMRDYTFPTDADGVFLRVGEVGRLPDEAAQLWLAPGLVMFEDDRRLPAPSLVAARISLPSDRSFADWETAISHLRGPPLPAGTILPVNDAQLDVLFEYPIASDRARFSIDPELARLGLRVVTLLRLRTTDGVERAFQFTGDPGLVRLDPRWHQAAWTFVASGFHHILDGIDHLLFLFCLVLPLRRLWPLVVVVTAFTVAHSITLMAAALGFAPDALWFPPLVETLIAASIVYMALENIVLAMGGMGQDRAGAGVRPPALSRRWLIAFGFGLVHGFGFSFALQETLQLAGSHLAASLVAFNVGVELGQMAVLLVAVPLLAFTFRVVVAERIGVIIASALVAHTAWHWMIDRGSGLGAYDWSLRDPATAAAMLRMTMALVALAGVLWLVRVVRAKDVAR